MIRRSSSRVIVLGLLSAASLPIAGAQFETRGSSPLPQGAFSIAVADFNHDGKLDLAVMGDNGFSVALGNGDGTFGRAVSYIATGFSIAAGDFNNDGHIDLVTANGSNSVSVFLGNGDGTFQLPKTTTVTADCSFVAVGDFNGDHKLDIVVIDSPYISVLIGNGDGTFHQPSDNNSFVGPQSLAVGDFNNDHKLDVAVVGFFGASSSVGVLFGNGDGTLQSSLTYPVSSLAPDSVTVSDFNHDGNLDLAAATELGPVVVLVGRGDGSFQPEVDYPITGGFGQISAADLNGDGRVDLGVSSSGVPVGVNVLLGNGDGTFGPASFYQNGKDVRALGIGDLNGDHKLDLVLGDTFFGAISLLNTGLLDFSPTAPLNFSVQVVNTNSAPKTVNLKNTGVTVLSIRSINVSGDFQASNNCHGRVAPGQSCKITAVFQPRALGSLSGLVTINDSASSKPQVVELSGQSTALQLSPGALSFGDQKVGTTSQAQQITAINKSSVTVKITNTGIGGADSNDFSESDDCFGKMIAAGASCVMSVTFTPRKTGSRTGTAFVDAGQGANPRFITLSGTGTNLTDRGSD